MSSTKYQIDDATFHHLTAWCERETWSADGADDLREKIVAYIESCEPDEAEYSMSHGWQHIRDLLTI